MNPFKAIIKSSLLIVVIICGLILLQGCGVPPRTEWTNDAESECDKSEAVYNGHRLFCVKNACTGFEEHKKIRQDAINECKKDNPDLIKIKDLVRKQIGVKN